MKKAFIQILTVSLLFIAHSAFGQCPSARDLNLIHTQGNPRQCRGHGTE